MSWRAAARACREVHANENRKSFAIDIVVSRSRNGMRTSVSVTTCRLYARLIMACQEIKKALLPRGEEVMAKERKRGGPIGVASRDALLLYRA